VKGEDLRVVTGVELETMSDEDLVEAVSGQVSLPALPLNTN
jgi:hypothetical protein